MKKPFCGSTYRAPKTTLVMEMETQSFAPPHNSVVARVSQNRSPQLFLTLDGREQRARRVALLANVQSAAA